MTTLNTFAERARLPRLIAVTGQEGSGKDSLGEYLAKIGYMHVSAGDVIRERARSLGHVDPISRTILSKVGDELKKEFGSSAITESSLQNYQKHQTEFPAGIVISGLRRVVELKTFKSHGAVSIWINADEKLRFQNITSRSRGDEQDFDSFVTKSREEYCGTTLGGEDGVNLVAIESLADFRVTNDGTLDELYDTSIRALSQLTS